MTGTVSWDVLIFIGGLFGGMLATGVAAIVASNRWTWWLSEQFKDTRHALDQRLTSFGLEIDELKAEVIRLKTIIGMNGKS